MADVRFVDGLYFQEEFETPQGSLAALADVHIFGRHLVLDELILYPATGEDRLVIGVRHALDIVRQIRIMAVEDGFEEITVVYHRIGKPRPGGIISRTRRLE